MCPTSGSRQLGLLPGSLRLVADLDDEEAKGKLCGTI